MDALLLVWILASAATTSVAADAENNLPSEASEVVVDVYYEALCPDSQKFFNHQLTPNLGLFNEESVRLNLIPFGKATFELDPTDNNWVFTCRHSETECEGHRIQACALDLLQPPVLYEYIACLMKRGDKDKLYPGKECADTMENVEYSDIEQCVQSSDVDEKIEKLKERTEALQPPIKSVPVIVFNRVYKPADQDLALKNFKGALCHYIKVASPKSHECLTSASGHSHTVTLILWLSALATVLVARS